MTGIFLSGILQGMEKLTDFIKAKGMTQSAFAESVGITQGALSKICRGPKSPSLETALAIERETGGAVAVADWPRFAALSGRLAKVKRSTRMGKSSNGALPDGSPALNNEHAHGGLVPQGGEILNERGVP